MQNEWRDFNGGAWENEVNVRDFIQRNYKPYDGDSSFLEGPTEDTTALWQDVLELSNRRERPAACSIWIQRSFPRSLPMDLRT